MWSASALEHFQENRFLGQLSAPDLEAEIGELGAPNYLRLQFRIEGGLVVDARFATVRCFSAIACANYACRWALGRSPSEFANLQAVNIVRELGPFPSDKALWATWVWAALQEAGRDWEDRC